MSLQKIIILAIIFYSANEIQCTEEIEKNLENHHDHKFDFLLFAQIWPISDCIEWEERSEDNTCSLPNRKNWTVHGIWPTKNFTIGPLYCNRSVHFDFDTLSPILDDLKLHWTNVRANTKLDNFWQHEWEKHGTCAMQLEAVDNEYKYFNKGLELNRKFPISQYLTEAKILPGGWYRTEELIDAVKKNIQGKNPALDCKNVEEYMDPVLTQISICLDKNFEPIGCESTHGGIYGRCPHAGLIEYPETEKVTPKPGPDYVYSWSVYWIIFAVVVFVGAFANFFCCFLWPKIEAYRRNSQYESL